MISERARRDLMKRAGFKSKRSSQSPRKPFTASAPPPIAETSDRRVAGHTAPIAGIHAPQPKVFGRVTLKAPTVAERRRFRRIREEIGCMACRREGRDPSGVIEVHHVLDGNRRISHMHTFGLCAVGCHQNGTADRPARHPMQGGRVLFERRVGATDFELLAECDALLGIAA